METVIHIPNFEYKYSHDFSGTTFMGEIKHASLLYRMELSTKAKIQDHLGNKMAAGKRRAYLNLNSCLFLNLDSCLVQMVDLILNSLFTATEHLIDKKYLKE